MPREQKVGRAKARSHWLLPAGGGKECPALPLPAVCAKAAFVRVGVAPFADGHAYAAEDALGIFALEPGFADTHSAFDAGNDAAQNWLPGLPVLRDDIFAACILEDFAAGRRSCALHLVASAFEIRLWKALDGLARGCRVSYGELAALAGEKPSYARAVGSALSRNRVALLLPCHRVLPAGGKGGGFRWGMPLKAKLLRMEQSSAAR